MEIEIEQLKKKNILPKVTEEPSRIKVNENVRKSQGSVEKCKNYADNHLFDSKRDKDKNKPAAQAAGADPSRFNSTNRLNLPLH